MNSGLVLTSLFANKISRQANIVFEVPEMFEEQDMIEAAADQLTAHKGNPMLMERNAPPL